MMVGRAHVAGHLGLGLDRRDLGEVGLERRDPRGLDRGLIHHALVQRAIFAVRRRGGDQLLELVLALVVQIVERADLGLVGGDLGLGEPRPRRIFLEVVAGLHRQVAAREVDAPRAERRMGRDRRSRGGLRLRLHRR